MLPVAVKGHLISPLYHFLYDTHRDGLCHIAKKHGALSGIVNITQWYPFEMYAEMASLSGKLSQRLQYILGAKLAHQMIHIFNIDEMHEDSPAHFAVWHTQMVKSLFRLPEDSPCCEDYGLDAFYSAASSSVHFRGLSVIPPAVYLAGQRELLRMVFPRDALQYEAQASQINVYVYEHRGLLALPRQVSENNGDDLASPSVAECR